MTVPEEHLPAFASPEDLSAVAELFIQREDGIGGVAFGCPRSEDIKCAALAIRTMIDKLNAGELPTGDVWRTAEILGDISAMWIDAEQDPIGFEAFDYIEYCIHMMLSDLKKILPEQAEQIQQWDNLRVAQRCIQRKLHYDAQKPRRFQWVSNIRVMIDTTLGYVLYKSGAVLKYFGSRLK